LDVVVLVLEEDVLFDILVCRDGQAFNSQRQIF
jgi:hypothetical protein